MVRVMAMGYLCDLGFGQSVYLETLHSQTLVTIASSNTGQQQQSSSGFQTGSWIAPPEMFRAPIGIVVKLHTDQGEWFVLIQGTRVSVSKEAPSWETLQPLSIKAVAPTPAATMRLMQPMKPMTPMQPMTMGNMQMDREAMSMQMGNMQMSMGSIAQPTSESSQPKEARCETTASQQNFCTQCGTAIKPGDRFCAHCGHQLA